MILSDQILKSSTIEEIDAVICLAAEKSASQGDGKRWTKESRTAIYRWVLRTLIYGELKEQVLLELSKIKKKI